ncbi:MAG: hypothetical protein ACRC5M_06510 [Anaeroplasmataceae bacterium]
MLKKLFIGLFVCSNLLIGFETKTVKTLEKENPTITSLEQEVLFNAMQEINIDSGSIIYNGIEILLKDIPSLMFEAFVFNNIFDSSVGTYERQDDIYLRLVSSVDLENLTKATPKFVKANNLVQLIFDQNTHIFTIKYVTVDPENKNFFDLNLIQDKESINKILEKKGIRTNSNKILQKNTINKIVATVINEYALHCAWNNIYDLTNEDSPDGFAHELIKDNRNNKDYEYVVGVNTDFGSMRLPIEIKIKPNLEYTTSIKKDIKNLAFEYAGKEYNVISILEGLYTVKTALGLKPFEKMVSNETMENLYGPDFNYRNYHTIINFAISNKDKIPQNF